MSNEMKDWEKENRFEVYSDVVCALTHTYECCEECRKCEGENGAAIRMNLIRRLAVELDQPVPWKEDNNTCK